MNSFKSKEVTGHFDDVAATYDYWKNKNWYYYDELKRIAAFYSRGGNYVLDAGCGTGTILRSLKVSRGTGLDISPEMVEIAKARSLDYKNLDFFVADIAGFLPKEKAEVILLFDVIEHLSDPASAIKSLAQSLTQNGKLVITMANPLWEPILMIAEKLHLKMPEGPHNRISGKQLVALAEAADCRLVARDSRLLFPKYLPVISYLLNSWVGRLPGLRNLSVIQVFIFSPK